MASISDFGDRSADGFKRGDVVWAYDQFKDSSRTRPWVILNNSSHPLAGEEYIAVPMTTVSGPDRIPVGKDDFQVGGLKEKSYVSPWVYVSIRQSACEEIAGRVSEEIVEEVREEFMQLTE